MFPGNPARMAPRGWRTGLRLDKGGFAYWWRSHLSAVPNHHIRAPVRFWSQEGPDEAVLQALAERRLGDLARLAPSPQSRAGAVGGGTCGGAIAPARYMPPTGIMIGGASIVGP